MTENKVSIVVPVYNAQKWLGYCLNSLLAQTWTEFEVILVNDGSTDDSLEICRNYAELDSRFRVLDVPNGGVSRARNLGVSQATGRYLVFVDSDDVVTPDMLEVMLDCARRTGMELVAGDMSLVGPRPERPQFVEKFREEIPRYMVKHQVRPGMTGWAQVNGYRGNTSIRKRIEYDLYYIENWTMGLDIKILILTVFKGFVNKNAY